MTIYFIDGDYMDCHTLEFGGNGIVIVDEYWPFHIDDITRVEG